MRRKRFAKPMSPPWWRRHWKAESIIALIGLSAAGVTFLPRASIDIGNPIDPSNAFSAPITVTNMLMPLEQVDLKLGVCQMFTGGVGVQTYPSRCDIGGAPAYISPPATTNHQLGRDEKWRVLFQDFALSPSFNGGDIRMALEFIPWPLASLGLGHVLPSSWLRHRVEYRFTARNDANGKWQWYATTLK
jgi:hypothetical protein